MNKSFGNSAIDGTKHSGSVVFDVLLLLDVKMLDIVVVVAVVDGESCVEVAGCLVGVVNSSVATGAG